jgi:hypothetical protein
MPALSVLKDESGDPIRMETPMRFLLVPAIAVALAGAAYGQGLPPLGIPLGEEKPQKPVDPVKENEYRSTLRGLPDSKPGDPWGTIRSAPAAPAQKKAAAPADKNAAAPKKTTATANKSAAPAKDAAAAKKAD